MRPVSSALLFICNIYNCDHIKLHTVEIVILALGSLNPILLLWLYVQRLLESASVNLYTYLVSFKETDLSSSPTMYY